MPSIVQIQTLLLLALATFAIAVPAPGQIQKRSFKVERVPNPAYKGRTPGAGTRALIKAYRKFSIPLPAGLLDAMSSAQGAGGAGDAGGAAGALAALEGLLGGGGAAKGTAKGEAGTGTGVASGSAVGAARPTAGTTGTRPKSTGTAGSSSTSNSTSSASSASNSSSRNSTSSGTNSTGAGVIGIVSATPVNGDIEYLSPVNIGGQTLNLDFDSGSSDLWVFNTQLAAASQQGHTNYDPTKSKNFQMINGATFTISYGDGSGASGNVGTDTVDIGGATVTRQAIELATAVSSSFVQDTASNGLVGLAFSKLNTVKPTQQKTFFDNVMPSLAEPVFTADLRKNAVGAYTFGAIDESRFNGSLNWAAVNTTQGFWQFSSQKFTVGTGPEMAVAGGQAIADTGTTLMLANPAIVNAYYSQVTGAVNNATVGGVTFPCNAVMPDLQFDVGGSYMALVRGSDVNFAPVDASGQTCFGGLQALAGPLQIYGDIMFKSQFVAFHGGNNSIGMAPHQ